ncbi:hypothetical protein G9A89_004486 [Geosiphon pyriformis]|nr:hypothetical protein G9A89_004486 [Geosiphon pyriformis]
MEVWTSEKGASKSLKKLDRPFKLPSEEVKRAVQIETALRKYNPEILDKINKGKFVEKFDVQIDNPFKINKNIVNLEETVEDIEDFKSGLSSRMLSPSLGQKNSKLFEKNAMSIEANQEEGWKIVVYGAKRHVLFMQILDILEKNMEKKVRDQARKILADVKIESFLMATNGIANQIAGQKKVLVRNIPLGISNREVGATMKEFGEIKKVQIKVAGKWQSAVIEFNNQEKATRAVDQWSTLIRKDVVRIYPIISTQKIIEQRKTWEAKLVGLPQNCTAHYLSTTLDQIKAQSCFIPRTSRNYTKMGCAYIGFDSETSYYNAINKPLVIGDTLVYWMPTDAKEQQVNEMTKLLNAVVLKLGVTVEEKNEGRVVNQPPSHISEEKKEEGNKKAKQDMFSKHTSEEKDPGIYYDTAKTSGKTG